MNTASQKSLSREVVIERAFRQHGMRHGDELTVNIAHRVSALPRKKALTRESVNDIQTVNTSELCHVLVHESETLGMCIRLVFGNKLLAVSGRCAEALDLWAEKARYLTDHQIIDKLPDMEFHTIDGQVALRGALGKQEIVMA